MARSEAEWRRHFGSQIDRWVAWGYQASDREGLRESAKECLEQLGRTETIRLIGEGIDEHVRRVTEAGSSLKSEVKQIVTGEEERYVNAIKYRLLAYLTERTYQGPTAEEPMSESLQRDLREAHQKFGDRYQTLVNRAAVLAREELEEIRSAALAKFRLEVIREKVREETK